MTDPADDNVPIPIAVPALIDQERFQRVAFRRKLRSPRKTPPLHVSPRTVLTGLCKCGFCESSMHIATGKSGKYRYLKCNQRNTVSNSICSSPNVPYERFEKLVIQSVIEQILTESHLKTILEDCQQNAARIGNNQSAERREVADKKALVERKLQNLYKLVEEGKVRIDTSLNKRLTAWQDSLEELNVKLASIKVPVVLPTNLLDQLDLVSFRSSVVSVLADPTSSEAITFMHLVVKEIRVYADEVTVSGPNLGVLEATLNHRRVAAPAVPSFRCNWRRGRDSNPR